MMLEIHKSHIYPVIVLVLLTYGIAFLLAKRRFQAIKKGLIPPGFFKDFQQRESFLIPTDVQLATRNFINLFEVPVLFYALIPLLILTNTADNISLFFSWAFVATRVLHSIIHVTTNKLFLRMRIYGIGSFILLLLWLRLAYQLL